MSGGSSGRPEWEKSGTKVLDPRAENLFALSTLTIRILRKTEDHLLRCTGPLMEKKGCLRRWGEAPTGHPSTHFSLFTGQFLEELSKFSLMPPLHS